MQHYSGQNPYSATMWSNYYRGLLITKQFYYVLSTNVH